MPHIYTLTMYFDDDMPDELRGQYADQVLDYVDSLCPGPHEEGDSCFLLTGSGHWTHKTNEEWEAELDLDTSFDDEMNNL